MRLVLYSYIVGEQQREHDFVICAQLGADIVEFSYDKGVAHIPAILETKRFSAAIGLP